MGMILSFFSSVMYLSEKITLWLTCVSLVCCLVITFVVTLGMGVGLGYNYCFVDLKTRYKYVPGHYIYPGSPRWPYKPRAKIDEVNEAERDNAVRAPQTLPPLDYSEFNANNVNRTDLGPDSPDHTSPTPDYNFMDSSEAPLSDWKTSTTISSMETSTNSSSESSAASSDGFTLFDRISTYNDTDFDDETSEAVPSSIVSNNDSTSRKVKKLVIPISGLDLISLLSKLRAENKNYSLQIVTT